MSKAIETEEDFLKMFKEQEIWKRRIIQIIPHGCNNNYVVALGADGKLWFASLLDNAWRPIASPGDEVEPGKDLCGFNLRKE